MFRQQGFIHSRGILWRQVYLDKDKDKDKDKRKKDEKSRKDTYKIHLAIPIDFYDLYKNKIGNILKIAMNEGIILTFKLVDGTLIHDSVSMRTTLNSISNAEDIKRKLRAYNNPVTIYIPDDVNPIKLAKLCTSLENELKNIPIKQNYLSMADLSLSKHVSFRKETINGNYIYVYDATNEQLELLKQEGSSSDLFVQLRNHIIEKENENKNIQALSKLNALIQKKYGSTSNTSNKTSSLLFKKNHSRTLSAKRLMSLLDKFKANNNDFTLGQLRDILYAEYRGIYEDLPEAQAFGKWSVTPSTLGRSIAQVINEIDKYDYDPVDDKMRKWKLYMAHYLLNYVSSHETSLKYKFLVSNHTKTGRKMCRKIKLAGNLAHQLLLCKNDEDYKNFTQKANKIIDTMKNNPKSKLYDPNSDLCKHLSGIVENLNNRNTIEKIEPSDSVRITKSAM